MLEGAASKAKVEKELKNLIDKEWDFKVKKLASGDYMATFPDVLSVEMFSKFSYVDLALYGLKAKISRTNLEASTSSVLQTTWVRIYGIPDYAKEEEIVKELTTLAVEPIKVDSDSLAGEDPVRVRVNCRDPAKLRGFVEVFLNGVGYELKFLAEGLQGKKQDDGPKGPPGNSRGNQDKHRKREDGNSHGKYD